MMRTFEVSNPAFWKLLFVKPEAAMTMVAFCHSAWRLAIRLAILERV